MPELRHDALSGHHVIVAAARALRPDTFRAAPVPPPTPEQLERCPFCEGHEAMTPPDVARFGSGAPDTRGWQVRVVPNLYPLVGGNVPGAHEVVILSPAHDHSFAQLPVDHAVDVMRMLQARSRVHLDAGARHVQPFLNHGRAAGASIEHPHAQLIALHFVPPAVDDQLARYAAAGADLVTAQYAEVQAGPCAISGGVAPLWCPPAASAPFEFVCAAIGAGPHFADADDDELAAVTRSLHEGLGRLFDAVGDVAYNAVVHTAPRDDDRPFHWYVRVTPRLAVLAGFEMGTGVFVNIVPPEQAAAALRDVRRS